MAGSNGNKPSSGLTGLKASVAAKRLDLAAWRRNQIVEMILPSGLPAKVRKLTMTDILLAGKLPPSIVDLAEEASKSGNGALDLRTAAKNAPEFTKMLDALVQLALVEPPIAETADDEHVTLAEISSNDKMAIFQFLNGEAEQLRPFREGEDEPAAPASAG